MKIRLAKKIMKLLEDKALVGIMFCVVAILILAALMVGIYIKYHSIPIVLLIPTICIAIGIEKIYKDIYS